MVETNIMLCRLYLKRKDRRKGKTLPVPSVSLRMKFTHLPSPTRPCFLNTDPWRSLSASGPLHLLVLLPGMLFIPIIACHVPSFYSGMFNYKPKDNLRFQSTAFFHRLEPSFPARFLRAFLCFPPPQGTRVCETLINTLLFGTNRVYLQCPVF